MLVWGRAHSPVQAATIFVAAAPFARGDEAYDVVSDDTI
jgi:hypothetical protein